MTTTANAFRRSFPEFGENTTYTDPVIDFWLGVADKLLNAARWNDLIEAGKFLFCAHNLVLSRQAEAAAANGAVPGQASGPVSQKSVDKVSVSYDTAAALEPEAGHWNLTTYGQRFIHLARLLGAGGLQVGPAGAGGFGAGPLSLFNAWAGPWAFNFPNMTE